MVNCVKGKLLLSGKGSAIKKHAKYKLIDGNIPKRRIYYSKNLSILNISSYIDSNLF